MEETGETIKNHCLTPSPWQRSRMPWPIFEPKQLRETAWPSGQAHILTSVHEEQLWYSYLRPCNKTTSWPLIMIAINPSMLHVDLDDQTKRYSVYSLVFTEVLTRPSSPSRPVHTETISIPRGIFQSSWQHIARKLQALPYLC